jgi:myo-inositol catabolism protein IolC
MRAEPDRVYMLAADHRWQWEEFCDARALPRERIPEVKRLAFDGFLLARTRSAAVRDFGALLIDAQYSSAVIADAMKADLDVGTPAEKRVRSRWPGPPNRSGVAHRRVRQGARAPPPGR